MLLKAGSGSKFPMRIADPDPGEPIESMRILIHNTGSGEQTRFFVCWNSAQIVFSPMFTYRIQVLNADFIPNIEIEPKGGNLREVCGHLWILKRRSRASVISIGKRFPGAQDPANKSAEPVPSTGGAGSQDVSAGGQGGGQAA
jgi:hypothetical protein